MACDQRTQTERELQSVLERHGVTRIEALGKPFNAEFHQAMMEQPSADVPGGSVIQTLQAGFELFGRTVRPAMVVVAAKGSGGGTAGGYAASAEASGGNLDAKA